VKYFFGVCGQVSGEHAMLITECLVSRLLCLERLARKGHDTGGTNFSSLKREWTGGQLFKTWQQAINDIWYYLAVHYN
jgi:hypothetical protein